ncbi:MAG TPA: response regulator [Terriglobales bacterium]|nr:response regulator [Terriglobales bacterium]
MARKILLADDSVTAQNMGRKILTDAGYEVITVNNGSAALKRIAEQKPDLIVLDVYMPGYSGLEVCQRIKENRETARIPVLLTVGKLEPFKPEEARRAQADAFVVKPFEASELLTTLTRLEDKIVPQPEPYKPGRFAKAFAAVEQSEGNEAEEKFGDKDSGWKNRLRFPSGKPKRVEPEADPEFVSGGRGIRDSEPAAPPPVAPPAAMRQEREFERPLPAGIPHDITPEEIAAITAAAAKMAGNSDAPAPASAAPAQAELPSANTEEALPPAPIPASSAPPPDISAVDTISEPAPVVAESASEVSTDSSDPVTFASASVLQAEVTEPTVSEPASPSLEPASIAVEPTASSQPAEAAVPETPGALPEEIPETLVPEAIPATPSVEREPEVAELQPHEPAPQPEQPAVAKEEERTPVAEPIAASPANAPLAASEAWFEPQPQIHTEAEVMAALQALIPPGRHGPATVATDVIELQGLDPAPTPAAEPVLAAAAESRQASPGNTRWIAEAAPVSPDEASLSLEKEMEKAYAAFAACEAAQVVAASAVAVEDRVAPVEQEAGEVPNTDPFRETVAEPVKLLASLTTSSVASEGSEAASVTQPVIAQAAEAPPAAQEEKVSQPESQVPAAEPGLSFGSAPAVIAESIAPPGQAFAAPVEPEIDIAGGIDDMGKKDWADFRSIKGTGPKPAKAASKERESEESPRPEPEPAAMAAAASAGGTSSTTPPADPRAIADIVDSVLAELRPKIVEEIAKKLADPRKE